MHCGYKYTAVNTVAIVHDMTDIKGAKRRRIYKTGIHLTQEVTFDLPVDIVRMLVKEIVTGLGPFKTLAEIISARKVSVPKCKRGITELFCHIFNIAESAILFHCVHKRNFNVKVVL